MARRKEKGERERRESRHGGYATRGRSRDDPGCVYLYEPGERTRNLLAVCSGWCVQRDARHRSTPSSRYRARGCVRAGWLASRLVGWGGWGGWIAGWLLLCPSLPLSLSIYLFLSPRPAHTSALHRTHTHAWPGAHTVLSGLCRRRLAGKWVSHQRVTRSKLAGASFSP